MRVNVDDVFGDPRARHVARQTKIDIFSAVGRLIAVWRVAYQRRSPWLLPLDIDGAADMDGFADAMVNSRLAFADAPPDHDSAPPAASFEATREEGALWVKGVRRRITHLLAAAEKGRRSGEARRARARSSTDDEPVSNTGSTPVEPRLNTSSTRVEPRFNTSSTSGSGSFSGSGSGYEVSKSGEDRNNRGSPPHAAPEGSPLRASGSGAGGQAAPRTSQRDPRTISNLADVEADYVANGKPIPWRDDPRRWAMTHDMNGKPVKTIGPRNGR